MQDKKVAVRHVLCPLFLKRREQPKQDKETTPHELKKQKQCFHATGSD